MKCRQENWIFWKGNLTKTRVWDQYEPSIYMYVALMIKKLRFYYVFSIREAFQKKNCKIYDIEQISIATYPPYLIMT